MNTSVSTSGAARTSSAIFKFTLLRNACCRALTSISFPRLRHNIDPLVANLLGEDPEDLQEIAAGKFGAFTIVVVLEQFTCGRPGKHQNRAAEIGVISDLGCLEHCVLKGDVVTVNKEQDAVGIRSESVDEFGPSKAGERFYAKMIFVLFRLILPFKISEPRTLDATKHVAPWHAHDRYPVFQFHTAKRCDRTQLERRLLLEFAVRCEINRLQSQGRCVWPDACDSSTNGTFEFIPLPERKRHLRVMQLTQEGAAAI